jgi:hypothetical protein
LQQQDVGIEEHRRQAEPEAGLRCTGRRAQACRRSHGKAQELPPIRQLDDTMRIMTELEGLPLLPPSSLLLLRSNAASCDLVHAMENALRAAFLPAQHA